MPSFGHSTQLRVFVDPDLLQYDEVWAAAGTWNDNFGAAPTGIVGGAGGGVADLKRALVRAVARRFTDGVQSADALTGGE